jgi:hypothetical protein
VEKEARTDGIFPLITNLEEKDYSAKRVRNVGCSTIVGLFIQVRSRQKLNDATWLVLLLSGCVTLITDHSDMRLVRASPEIPIAASKIGINCCTDLWCDSHTAPGWFYGFTLVERWRDSREFRS